MITLTYEMEINASAQKVWDVLWNKETYEQWTSAFMPGSKMETDWKVGGKTLFLSPEGDGMVSTIQSKNEPYEIIFKHLGVVNKGVEDTASEKVKAYQNALEKYTLTEENGKTKLVASVETPEEYKDHMEEGFTKGFEIIKKLAEK